MKHLSNLHAHLVKHKTLSIIAITEAIIIVVLLVYIASFRTMLTQSTQAQDGNEADNQITQAVLACNKLPPTERPPCAKAVGIQVESLFASPEDRIKQCIKMRPLMVRYCQEGLLNAN